MIRLDTISPERAAVPAAPFVATGGPVARSPAQPKHAAGQRLAGSPTIAQVQRAVAKIMRVPLRHMTAPDQMAERVPEHCHPRQVAIYLARNLCRVPGYNPGDPPRPAPLQKLGRHFGHRDHTTILAAIRRVERRLAEDADLRAKVERVRRELGL